MKADIAGSYLCWQPRHCGWRPAPLHRPVCLARYGAVAGDPHDPAAAGAGERLSAPGADGAGAAAVAPAG